MKNYDLCIEDDGRPPATDKDVTQEGKQRWDKEGCEGGGLGNTKITMKNDNADNGQIRRMWIAVAISPLINSGENIGEGKSERNGKASS